MISTTDDHPFYIKNHGFINAGQLQVGNEVINSNGDILVVEDIKIEFVENPVTVYNFQVEDFHTYHVGDIGVLVHNAGKDYQVPKSGKGQTHGRKSDVPERFKGQRPFVGEKPGKAALRVIEEVDKIPKNKIPTGPTTDHNMLKKYFENGFQDPKNN